MGLDNGMAIRFRQGKEPKWAKRLCVLDDKPKGEFGRELELAYWRKCWNVRYAVLDELRRAGRLDDEDYVLSADELRKACKAIGKVLNKKDWDEAYCDGGTIWDWNDVGPHMKRQNRLCLKAAKRLKGMDPSDYYLIFYDSY